MTMTPEQIAAATDALRAISEGFKHLPGQHDQSSHGRRGASLKPKLSLRKMRGLVSEIDGYVPLSKITDREVLSFARELGNLTYGDYTTKIDLKASDASPESLHVSSDIFYKKKRIGYFSRVIQYNDNSLYNNSLTIKPEYQGQGVAEAIYRHVEKLAAQEGVTEVRLTANDDIGGYAWARRGFQWATPKDARGPVSWVKEIARGKPGKSAYIGENGDWFTLTPELIADAKELVAGGRIPTPAEIASLGERRRGTHITVNTKAGKPIPLWIGKSIMLGSSWNGVKPIGVGLWKKKDALEDWVTLVEEALPHAISQYVPGDVFRPHDGATSDYNVFGADLFAQPTMETKSWIDSYKELAALLESKQRHVRDAAFWGAPVGTPLPLPDKPDVNLRVAYRDSDVYEGDSPYSGTTVREPGVDSRGNPNITPVAGTRIHKDDLPDVLYHVTTNADALAAEGVLRMQDAGDNAGLGGGHKNTVSLTADRDVALGLLRDMRFFAGLKNLTTTEDIDAAVADYARQSGMSDDDITGGFLYASRVERERVKEGKTSVGGYIDYVTSQFFSQRSREGKGRNPIIFGGYWKPESPWWQINPDAIGMIRVRKADIPDDVLITDFDRGQSFGLEEVRVHGDIPLRSAQVSDIRVRRPVKSDPAVWGDIATTLDQLRRAMKRGSQS